MSVFEIFDILFKEQKHAFKELSPTARTLTGLALVSGFFAIAWLAVTAPSTHGTVLWVAPTAFALLAAMFVLMAALTSLKENAAVVRKNTAVIREIVKQIQPVHSGFYMGCRIGRRRLECGIIEVMPQDTRLTSDGLSLSQDEVRYWTDGEIDELSEGALVSHSSLGRFKQANLYRELVASMGKLFTSAYKKNVRINSIGIAVPGGVYPDAGRFDGLVEGGPFLAGEDITQKVAKHLVREVGVEVLEEVLGTSNPEAMRAKIHLDNDARCAARWLLVENPTWKNIACVFAGSGVGSGLAFAREVFYGNRFRAGEIGHVNLNPGSLFLLDKTSGQVLQPRHCSCGKEGYHFESLVGIGGLGHLAQVIYKGKLTQICDTYMADPDQCKQLQAWSIDDDDANGRVILYALAYVGQENPVFAPYIEPSEEFLKFIHNKPISDYLECVATTYARLFGTGIAALVAALDVEHVALCGTIPEFLQNNLRFITEVRKTLDDNLPGTPKGAALIYYGDMRHWGWRGAALLPNDSGYMRRRFPQRLSLGEPKTDIDIEKNQARQLSRTAP
jgi:predicted NBD/HSP70 family sugar kinase